MADPITSPATAEPISLQSEPEKLAPQSNQPDQLPPSSSSTTSTSVPVNPNPTPTPPPPAILPLPQPPSIQPYAPPQVSTLPPAAPSFRPATPPVPLPSLPQFSPIPVPNLQNPNFQSSGIQNPSVPPPGVSSVPGMVPGAVPGAGSAPPVMAHYAPPGQPPNPALRPYVPMPNGYPPMPAPVPQGTIPPPGLPRYPSPYTPMVRTAFPPRPPGVIGVVPPLSRPTGLGIRGPIAPVVRPAAIPSVTPTEKPQTTVYVGKIASTVESDFILSLLQLCGPVKNWKRVHGTNGTPKGFGFCEFESSEGVLRALRLLNKLNVDGQELLINVDQVTKEYLERYFKKKAEDSKNLKEAESEMAGKEEESAPSAEKSEPPKPSAEDSKKDDGDSVNEAKKDTASFGIVTDEDKEADQEALEKLTSMIEERLKNRPLPPPPPPPQTVADGSGNSNSDQPARSKDVDSDVDIMRNDAAEDKNDDEMTSERKTTSEHDKPETSSPDRGRRNDRKSRDKERDLKRERELERYEREREQDRARREREREYKLKEDERRYKARVKEWESREREKEYLRKLEKEKDKEREYKRKREIMDQEHESDDGDYKRRKHKSSGSEERRRRLREKEDDLADRLKEEEEAVEAKRRADEELQKQKEELQKQKQREKEAVEVVSGNVTNGSDKAMLPDETDVESKDKAVEETYIGDSGHVNHIGGGVLQNGNGDEAVMGSIAASDLRQNSNVPAKKLGFGLMGSGKRTAVLSVFNEEEDEDAQKEKKMRPLVPIDYSTEELQAVHSTTSNVPSPNLAAAAEFAKRISGGTPKEDRPDTEKERSRRSHDRSSQRDRGRNDDETTRARDESKKETFERDRDREQGLDKAKTQDNQKLLDAKQLIDMIPKTKDELFSYEINWAIYDKNELHDRMRPWISKKITEFLGEEETTLVDYIVSSTREHVKATEMLDRLQSILDDEAEMFVLKMWRMLIFEIKKIETGLALRSKS